MSDNGRPDRKAAGGMIGVAVIVGAFLGYVLTFGDLIGAAGGIVIMVIVSIIYLLTFPEVTAEEMERPAH